VGLWQIAEGGVIGEVERCEGIVTGDFEREVSLGHAEAREVKRGEF